MKILFICKYNRFRSQLAEAWFRKLNRSRDFEVSSAGIIRGIPVAENVKKIGRKFGLKVKSKPKAIREEFLIRQDLVVVVANNVPASVFKSRVPKVLVWKIADKSQNDLKGIEKTAEIIGKKVKNLIKKLEGLKK